MTDGAANQAGRGGSPAAEAAAPANQRCPTCGAEIKRRGMSLCPYCASPLELGGATAAEDEGLRTRLGRMAENKQHAVTMAWDPPEGEVFQAAARRERWGRALLAAGAALALLGLVGRGPDGLAARFAPLPLAAGAAAAAGGFELARRARAQERRVLSLPLLKRPALVTDRRSETALETATGRTTYYFTLKFEDGSEAEFRFPGRGTSYEPMATGATGVAFTRGVDLLAFKTIRV